MTTAENTRQLKINGVDAELVRRAKYAALDRGLTLREFVMEALDHYARETEESSMRSGPRPHPGRSRRPPPRG